MLTRFSVSSSLWPVDCSPAGSSIQGIPGKNTGVGCHALLQGIFLTKGSNPYLLGLLHWLLDSMPPAMSKIVYKSYEINQLFFQAWETGHIHPMYYKYCKHTYIIQWALIDVLRETQSDEGVCIIEAFSIKEALAHWLKQCSASSQWLFQRQSLSWIIFMENMYITRKMIHK